MIKIRKAKERGGADYGWLKTSHTFSFNTYYDPEFLGFRTLRVINEDFVEPGRGFGTHGHQDMEIISYVVEGELAHKDSSGGSEVLRPHEVQRMTAGTGIRHSEFNPSKENRAHFYQVWIAPETTGLSPEYEQRLFSPQDKKGRLKLVASRSGTDGSVRINQDVRIYASILPASQEIEYRIEESRHVWIQLIKGSIDLNGNELSASDGAAISEENNLEIKSLAEDTEFLLFDLK